MGFPGPSVSYDPVSQQIYQTGMSEVQSSPAGRNVFLGKKPREGWNFPLKGA